jgi:hypothetical protein
MMVVWGDGKVTLIEDDADDDEPLTDAVIDELAELLASSSKLAFVLDELAAQVEEHSVAGRCQAAANTAAVLAALAARTRQAMH